jgi:hypothetical protein
VGHLEARRRGMGGKRKRKRKRSKIRRKEGR